MAVILIRKKQRKYQSVEALEKAKSERQRSCRGIGWRLALMRKHGSCHLGDHKSKGTKMEIVKKTKEIAAKYFNSNKLISFPEYMDEEIDLILDEATESEVLEYKPISETMQIAFVLLGSNGIYFFTQSKTDSRDVILSDIGKAKEEYLLPLSGCYFFIRTHKTDYFSNGYEFNEIEDAPQRFVSLYKNSLRPAVDVQFINWKCDYEKLFDPDLPEEYKDEDGNPVEVEDTGDVSFVAPLVSKSILKLVSQKIDEAEVLEEGMEVKYDEDGIKYRKHSVRTKVFGYSFKDVWYPVASDDPKAFTLKTLLGGWFGLHKFITGEKAQGFLYLITCGGFGVFYLFDLLMIVLGNYSITRTEYEEAGSKYKKKTKLKVYLDKIDSPAFCLAISIAGLVISYVTTNIVYMNVLKLINNGFANVMIRAFGSV